MLIAVAGGTGVVGRHVVEAARARGHQVVVLTRSTGVDLESGTGLEGRLDGVRAVVDATSVVTLRGRRSEQFFAAVADRLLAEGARAGVEHHVALSIVGIDAVPSGYYAGKVVQEARVARGQVPWSLLRSTQFHEFAEQTLAAGTIGPVALVPVTRCRPVAAHEVAQALLDLAEAAPAGRVPDLAGPREEHLVDLVRQVVRRRGARRRVVPLRLPGAAGRAVREGALLPAGEGPRGVETFAEWLERT